MEIKNTCYSSLTNFEVLEALKAISKKDTKKKYGLRNLATITYETLQYLEETPVKSQTKESITDFLREVSQYKLTKNEILMIVNDPPSKPYTFNFWWKTAKRDSPKIKLIRF
uniref:DNA-directed RNA polymerase III subunit RPC9 n=1 Tax=Megaselia scalaris TaxID=36166 RepID=T1GGU0_MEGSC